jgi:hypothetical protein
MLKVLALLRVIRPRRQERSITHIRRKFQILQTLILKAKLIEVIHGFGLWGEPRGAPDPRGLPEWIEFKWQEQPPELRRKDGNERTREEVLELLRKLSIKTYQVQIKSRIPQQVVDEIIEAKRKREKNQLPKKMLWLEFIWVGDEIKLSWKMTEKNDKGVNVVLK